MTFSALVLVESGTFAGEIGATFGTLVVDDGHLHITLGAVVAVTGFVTHTGRSIPGQIAVWAERPAGVLTAGAYVRLCVRSWSVE